MTACTTPAELVRRFEESWNAHDMAAFGRLLHAHATFVNRFGTYWRGVEAIVAGHVPIHETIYSDSVLTADAPDIDSISEDAVILHVWLRLAVGKAHPAGPHTIDTLVLAVAVRREGGWRFQAMENVTLVDPRTGEPRLRT